MPVAAASPTMLAESAVTTMASAKRQERNIGVLARAVPEEPAVLARQAAERVAPGGRRAARGGDHQATPPCARASRQVPREARDVRFREPVVAAVAARQHGDARVGQDRRGADRASARAAARRSAETRCGGVRVGTTFGPAQAVVAPATQIRSAVSAPVRGSLRKTVKVRPPEARLTNAQIGDGPAAGGEGEVRERAGRAASCGPHGRSRGSIGPQGISPGERRARPRPGGSPARARGPRRRQALQLVAGLAVGQNPGGRDRRHAQHSVRMPLEFA